MAISSAKTVSAYLEELPAERRKVVNDVRDLVKKNLPKGYEEGMQYGMITYYVPLSVYPKGYLGNPNVPVCYVALAAQKNYYALYLMGVYTDPAALKKFREHYKKEGKKLDIGKSCVRFRKWEDLSTRAVAEEVKRMPVSKLTRIYDESRTGRKARAKK